jgi:DNA replication and repair protein RecF
VQLALHPGLNLIWGDNGSGKTSLLEAIFLLGRGRSFRTRNSERLIRHGEERLVSFGRATAALPHLLGVQVSKSAGTEAKVDGSPVSSLAELSQAFPVQVIEPGVHRLVEEGGRRRRRWLDWAVFHVEPTYIGNWTRYSRALQQRNAALRVAGDSIDIWNEELARYGELVAASRSSVMERLQPYWTRTVQELTDLEVELSHHQGWPAGQPLAAALAGSTERDRMRGLTHDGPHRADVRVRIHGRTARDVLSRGQQKLVAVAMILSQLELLQALMGAAPTLLLDDPAAELDQPRFDRFIQVLRRTSGQLIATSLRPDLRLFDAPDRVFHVEQGGVQPV